jgi:PEP-CTERM motif-containing protein
MKAQKFSLLGALAAALLFSAAFVPQANASFLVVYFNFEDGTLPPNPSSPGTVDLNADCVPGTPGCGADSNTGGGIQNSTLTIVGTNFKDTTGTTLNRSTTAVAPTNDQDTAIPGQALVFTRAGGNQGSGVCFDANTAGLTNLALSFAVNNSGNGYTNVDLTVDGASTTGGTGITLTTSPSQLITFDSSNSTINSVANDGVVTFCLVFTGGQSNGANGETIIDNIQLTAVPEPSTVMAGLLGAFGLCWHQRRRLIRFLSLRAA